MSRLGKTRQRPVQSRPRLGINMPRLGKTRLRPVQTDIDLARSVSAGSAGRPAGSKVGRKSVGVSECWHGVAGSRTG